MSVVNELTVPETRTILGPAGNRVSVSEHENNGKKEKTPEKPKKLSSVKPEPVRDNVVRSKSTVKISSAGAGVTVLSSASCAKKNVRKDKKSECQSTLSNVKAKSKTVKQPSVAYVPLKQCDWITPFSGMSNCKALSNHFFVLGYKHEYNANSRLQEALIPC